MTMTQTELQGRKLPGTAARSPLPLRAKEQVICRCHELAGGADIEPLGRSNKAGGCRRCGLFVADEALTTS